MTVAAENELGDSEYARRAPGAHFWVLELTFEALGGLGGAFGLQKSVLSMSPVDLGLILAPQGLPKSTQN